MCGIALLVSEQSKDERRSSMKKMLRALAHRGPDDEGIWTDEDRGVAVGHRRLSILDTSPRGHQPMLSESGRYVIAYNGEIYNYREMREELDAAGSGHAWHSGSDTEVLLAAIEHFGLDEALGKAAGMFALVLWDRRDKKIFLARDRIGKKPLYYGIVDGKLVAASELSALRAILPDLRVDIRAMALLSRFGFIPEPFAAYEGIEKLLPGSILEIPVETFRTGAGYQPRPYYRLDEVIAAGETSRRRKWTEAEVVDLVEKHLETAVSQRMRSDVPFGAFLSGGIDSSLVVALMQRESSVPVRTFSLGFEEEAFDESKHAKRIAEHLGTEHSELIVREQDVLDVVPDMATVYDEPFADSSQLPTTLVARLAKQHVTVVLTGDGGDEVFAGYNRHVWGLRAWRLLSRVPKRMRGNVAKILGKIPPDKWDGAVERLAPLTPSRFRVVQAGEKVGKLARLSECTSPEQIHLDLATYWRSEERVTRADEVPRMRSEGPHAFLDEIAPLERALWFDTIQGLPGDMLVKVDRATMSVGLEARQPLLDHRLYDASWQIPHEFKIRHGVGKWPLRELLARQVPRPLWERPKSGFSVPIDAWLRGPLRPWAEELLSETKLDKHDVFRREPVREAWDAHLSGRQNHGARLWAVLSAQAWLDKVA